MLPRLALRGEPRNLSPEQHWDAAQGALAARLHAAGLHRAVIHLERTAKRFVHQPHVHRALMVWRRVACELVEVLDQIAVLGIAHRETPRFD